MPALPLVTPYNFPDRPAIYAQGLLVTPYNFPDRPAIYAQGLLVHSCSEFVAQLAWIMHVTPWQILPEPFPDAWFRLATALPRRIGTINSYDLIRKIETFSQVSGKDRSIPRKTP